MSKSAPIEVTYNKDGLVPVIAQSVDTGDVLMLAWMNAEAVRLTLTTGQVHYWSRSRKEIWRKGATSGHEQTLVELLVDCDGDTLLARVHQTGNACHTGNANCFFTKLEA